MVQVDGSKVGMQHNFVKAILNYSFLADPKFSVNRLRMPLLFESLVGVSGSATSGSAMSPATEEDGAGASAVVSACASLPEGRASSPNEIDPTPAPSYPGAEAGASPVVGCSRAGAFSSRRDN